jgi:16S rRNA (cytosine967-C5)-methyltransferase
MARTLSWEKSKAKSGSGGVSPARERAYAILLAVEQERGHSDDLLRADAVSAMSQADRNLCTALVMGTLRWQIRLDAKIAPLLKRPKGGLDPEVRVALRLGAFQLLLMDRIPAHAAIGESVELAKQAGHRFASGMVNAVLRKLATESATAVQEDAATDLEAETAHPGWMLERWIRFYGLERARAIWLHGQRQPMTALRLGVGAVESELVLAGVRTEPGELLAGARIAASGDVTATAAFREGRVRIQEEGSQLIAELAGSGQRILDCCAAPGGKTLVLAGRNPEAAIVACEIDAGRLEAMRRRLATLPEALRIELRLVDATALTDEAYDLVLADVPCSGTGTLGRNPEIRHRLAEADLKRHHERQVAILSAALRAGTGRVVYSTCSLEPEENGDVVVEVLVANPDWRQVSLEGRVRELAADGRLTERGTKMLLDSIGADGSLQLLPGQAPGDGYFVALLSKKDS